MDAIRKKMKSLKDETDQLYAIINKFEDATKEANRVADQVLQVLHPLSIAVMSETSFYY